MEPQDFFGEWRAPSFATALRWREQVRAAGGAADVLPHTRDWFGMEWLLRVTKLPQTGGQARRDLLPADMKG